MVLAIWKWRKWPGHCAMLLAQLHSSEKKYPWKSEWNLQLDPMST
jgi:hypothetical protein